MDFNRVFSQAISRTVNKCYAEESEISVAPFLHWSFNPLIPPGCIPFLELAGLESGDFYMSKILISFLINFLVVEMVINQMNAEDDDEKETEENDDREEEMNDSDWSEVDSVDVAPDIQHAECSKCGKDFSPAWTKIKDKGSPVFLIFNKVECLPTAPCGIRTKCPSGRLTPLYSFGLVYCIACMNENSRAGIIEENQERMTRIVR